MFRVTSILSVGAFFPVWIALGAIMFLVGLLGRNHTAFAPSARASVGPRRAVREAASSRPLRPCDVPEVTMAD